MATYDSNDALFTWDGDYEVGPDGDLGNSLSNPIAPLLTQIHQILRSETGDWLNHTFMGSNLSDFHGEPNTPASAKLLEERIRSSLTAYNTVRSEDLIIRVIPINSNQLLIALAINVNATPTNGLKPGEPAVISLTYDSLEDQVFFMPINQLVRNYGA